MKDFKLSIVGALRDNYGWTFLARPILDTVAFRCSTDLSPDAD